MQAARPLCCALLRLAHLAVMHASASVCLTAAGGLALTSAACTPLTQRSGLTYGALPRHKFTLHTVSLLCSKGLSACSVWAGFSKMQQTPPACPTPAGPSCLQQEYFSLLSEVLVRRREPREPSSPRRRAPDAPASLEELWQRQQQEEQGTQQPACNGGPQGSMENGQGPAKRVRFTGTQAEGSSERGGGSTQVGHCCVQLCPGRSRSQVLCCGAGSMLDACAGLCKLPL